MRTDFLNVEESSETLLYESNLESYPSYNTKIYDQIYLNFKITLGENIDNIIRIQSTYIGDNYIQTVNKDLIKKILHSIYLINNATINATSDRTTQQLFLLHLLCSFFQKYARDNNYDFDKYNSFIYVPSILLGLVHFLADAKKYIYKIINIVINDIVKQSRKTLEFYSALYNVDLDIIRSDLVYYFIEHILPDKDPLVIDNLDNYYITITKRIIYYYLKLRTSNLATGDDPLPIDIFDIQDDRFNIYESGIYLCKLASICSNSRAADIISKNYNSLTDQILTNEFQKIILSIHGNTSHLMKTSKQTLIDAYTLTATSKELKLNWPLIYRILRSIRIKSNVSILNDVDIEKLKLEISDMLYLKIISNTNTDKATIADLVETTSTRLAKSFKNSSFIDPLTMEVVYIEKSYLISQVIKFLDYILDKVI